MGVPRGRIIFDISADHLLVCHESCFSGYTKLSSVLSTARTYAY